jgi:hypothetical protein
MSIYPEDRVLVGVVKSTADLQTAREQRWYRIPQAKFPHGIHAEYIGLFSGEKVIKRASGIYHYGHISGIELRYRRELLPHQPSHPDADVPYYRIAFDQVLERVPPILNPTKRRFAFIFTTGDRFSNAENIADLYSKADYFVDRIYHALRNRGFQVARTWEAQTKEAPRLRILCQQGVLDASTEQRQGMFYLNAHQKESLIFAQIHAQMAQLGGAALVNVPLD